MAPVLYYMPEAPPSRAIVMCIRYLELQDIELKTCRTFLGENSEPEFVKKNPQKTVPFLDDNGFYLTESRAIMLYLVHSRAPESILIGRFPKQRAMIQNRLDFELGTISQIEDQIIVPVVMGNMTVVPQQLKDKLYKALELTNGWLSKTAYVADDFISIADFSYLAVISSFIHCGVPVEEKFPHIWAWYQRCKTLAGYEENEEGAQTLGRMFKEKLAEPF